MSGESEIAAQVVEATKAAEKKRVGGSGKRQQKSRKHFPFKIENGQLWHETSSDLDGETRKRWVPFGSELNVLARTRSREGQDHGRLLEIVDRDGERHLWAMPAALLAGSGEAIRAELLRLGWEPVPGAGRKWRDWLLEFLIAADPEDRARCVSGIGWHGEAFVLPDETITAGEAAERVILQTAAPIDHALATSGTLDEWRDQVARQAIGNSRLVLALSAAFAAPLLALTGEEGGGFHFRGSSSSGKSTALAVAGSVWGGGGPRGYVQSWRATDNALEALAAMHNSACLCLDELAQVEGRAAAHAAYMLSNGQGKARAGREGQARKSHEWKLIFLSSGEIGLEDKIKESGGRVAAGMEVRVVDLRADAGAGLGLFEDLHDIPHAATFAQRLKIASGRYYGNPSREFLRALVPNLAEWRTGIEGMRKEFLAAAVPIGADGQVRRVADRFALVAAAGEVATNLEITGWPEGEALRSVLRCFKDWLSERGGHGSGEVADAKARLRRAIEADGHSRFLPWFHDPRTVIRTNALGYVKRPIDDEPASVPEFYLHASGMAELLSGLDRKAVLDGLADDGVIVRHEVTRRGSKVLDLSKPFKVPSEKALVRLYQIDLAALTGEVVHSND
ncbi:DUF927 domain-containing protein [Paracoccus onubensis]|uniref:DUF927 domain-containing protein n=1 Tax=Paracoccus onubensis TaxID=1675788 RepID=A0A418SWW7_9RHOB|nr:DUF927 domain-containing protein [Paracoccus onubensis]RJE85453.1 DUF927 domain-containing protein [Paracoccus onubensis]